MVNSAQVITVRVAARLAVVSCQTIYNWIREGKFKTRKAKFGEISIHLIDRDSFLAYCREQERPVNESV
jgi:hypothetical protein